MKRFDVIILTVAVALIMGGIGFGIGRLTASKTTVATAGGGAGSTSGGSQGFGSGGGRRFGGRPIFGTVGSVSGNTLTISASDGTTHTVTLSTNTTYTNGDGSGNATIGSLTPGVNVAAFGTAASDGTLTATRVIINPQARASMGSAPTNSAPAN